MDVFYSTPAFSFGPSIGLENNVAHIEVLTKVTEQASCDKVCLYSTLKSL